MSEEYDLNRSEEKVGQLYPVLRANYGDNPIIDGFHRKHADPEWREVILQEIDTREKYLKARIIANLHRRTVPAHEIRAWINELADHTHTERGVKPGEISGWIAQETGYAERTVQRYLDEKHKNPNLVRTAEQIRGATETPPNSAESDAVDRPAPDRYHQLRKTGEEAIEHIAETSHAPDAAEGTPTTMEDIPGETPETDTQAQAELRQVGREIGAQMREAFSRLDTRPNKSRERFALKGRLLMVAHQLESRTLYHPTDPQATLVWSNGDTIQRSLELLEAQP